MQLYIDLNSSQFITDPNFKAPVDTLSFKRGDSATIRASFVSGNSVAPLASGADIRFGIKEVGKYDGDFLVYTADYVPEGTSYLLAPSFNTEALDEALSSGDEDDTNDVASVSAMLEITWSEDSGTSWKSTNAITAIIQNDVIKGIEGTPADLPDALDWLYENGAAYKLEVNSLTGGMPNDLDAVPTVDVPVGALQLYKSAAGQVYTYRLATSTAATNEPSTIRPIDYHNPDNKKAWLLVSQYVNSLTAENAVLGEQLGIIAASGSALIEGDALTDDRYFEFPDVDGVIPSVPAYADLTAANAALGSGDFFWDATLKKLRTATA